MKEHEEYVDYEGCYYDVEDEDSDYYLDEGEEG